MECSQKVPEFCEDAKREGMAPRLDVPFFLFRLCVNHTASTTRLSTKNPTTMPTDATPLEPPELFDCTSAVILGLG